MSPSARLLQIGALAVVSAGYLLRHSEQRFTPDLFIWTTARIFALLSSLWITYIVFIYPFLLSPLRHLPGPSGGNLIWGHETALYKQPRGDIFYNWMETIPNDGLLRFRGLGNTDILIATSPAALAEVMNRNSYDFIKPKKVSDFLRRVLGQGVLLAEGEQHKFQRKNLSPAFHVRHIRELTGVFWAKAVELIDTMGREVGNKGGNLEFGDWASRVALDIIGIAGMGHDFRAIQEPHQATVEKYSSLLEPSIQKGIYFAVNMIFPMWLVSLLPWKINGELKDIVITLNKLARSLVLEKKAKLADGKERTDKDILSVALESNAFTDDEMVDQLLTFLAAGHETTASTITWTLYLLANRPAMQERLRAEIRAQLPSPLTNSESPSWEDLESLPYLNAVANETMRYIPTVPVTSRQAIRDTTILDQRIPAGARVFLVPWGTNKSTKLWGPDANSFNPDRWMEPGASNTGGAATNYANMSFLHGPRSCIGQAFARGESKCLIAAVVGRFKVEMQRKGEQVAIGGVITTKPVGGMNLRFTVVDGW